MSPPCWGRVDVVDADDGYDEPVEPKEGERSVPIPPVLVAMLRTWIEDHQIGPDELLFRTRNNRRPSESNWNRAIKRACRRVGARAMCVYDCRHAAATFWLRTAATANPSKGRSGERSTLGPTRLRRVWDV